MLICLLELYKEGTLPLPLTASTQSSTSALLPSRPTSTDFLFLHRLKHLSLQFFQLSSKALIMKLTQQTSVLLLAAISSQSALALPVAEVSEGSTVTISHTDNGTAIFPINSTAPKPSGPAPTKCMTFTFDNPDWYYANAGPWGTASGTFGSTGGKICVPENDSAGGAMFIGTEANPSGGNTKLEIFFPLSGDAYGDVSLVDGYSLSVTCQTGSVTIGGPTDLFKTGKTCEDTSLLDHGICKNDKGYADTQDEVTDFFQAGLQDGNAYCIWKNCAVPAWDVTDDITCHVSGGQCGKVLRLECLHKRKSEHSFSTNKT
ncbi:hypothetical protein G7Y79_00050g086090 [Physcia stellaris]|nr:hypothetical protein G7Y79_00050g086090 [Physcia stellaris]